MMAIKSEGSTEKLAVSGFSSQKIGSTPGIGSKTSRRGGNSPTVGVSKINLNLQLKTSVRPFAIKLLET